MVIKQNRILVACILLSGLFSSCSIETLYRMQQRRKIFRYEQVNFQDLAHLYMNKNSSSVGTVEGIYSVTSIVTKKGKGLLSNTEKEKVVSRDENHLKVAIIRDPKNGREYIEVPLRDTNYPSYDIKGEFTSMSDGNILVYKQFESRGRSTSYTFTFDKGRDILEGIRTDNSGNFEYTYKLTYLKLSPKASP